MTKKSLAEALYLFNTIENLLRRDGAKGESFSDLVKSYDHYQSHPDFKACRGFIEQLGNNFYYSREDGEYYIKDDAQVELHEPELEYYRRCREKIKKYYQDRDKLMDGFYNNLRTIGHERNQLLHIHGYTIKNFSRFKKACFQVIRYLETKKKLSWDTIIDLKEPEPPKVSHQSSRIKKRSYANSYESREEKKFPVWFIVKMLAVSVLIYYLMHRYELCRGCSGLELAGIYGVGSVAGAFALELIFILALGLFVEYAVPALLMFGGLYLLISCSDRHKHTSVNHSYTTSSSALSRTDTRGDNMACTYYYVLPDHLNIRKKPTIKSYKNGQLRKNEKVCVRKVHAQWSYVENKGWVLTKYLSTKQ